VAWLADDAREGRGVGTRGLDAATAWLEERFRVLGLEPAGDDGFRHRIDVPTAVQGRRLALAVDGQEVAPLAPAGFSASGTVEAPVVYAGYGIVSPGHDDYHGLDVKNRIVLVRRFAPDSFDLDAQRKYSDVRRKAWTAREHGARALLVADLPDPGESRAERDLPHPTVDVMGDAGLPVVYLGRAAATALTHGRHRARLEVGLEVSRAPTWNVVGRLRGSGRLPGVVVVGAHYDHLGFGGPASLAPEVTAVHGGADDNASGTAALLGVAAALAARRGELARDVVFVAFSGEEEGALGSTAFTRTPPRGLAMTDIAAMLNMDMVGRMRDGRLQVLGGETAAEWATLVPPVCARLGIDCGLAPGGYGASDHTPFYAHGVPVLHFFTGTHRDYHKPTDRPEYINAAGGAAVAELVADMTLVAAAQPKLTLKATAAPQPVGDLRAAGASLGTVPDYVGPPDGQPGVLLAGVRPGGPAEAAGLMRGDILIAIDGHTVRTVEDFMYVLSAATPGAHARVTVIRAGRRVELDAVFGPPTRR
jgi:hypothetical protein